jgi:hypothetical protein
MEKFAKVLTFIFILSGCASVQMPGYISRVDHPYERKFYASFEKVTSTFMYVLKKQGWTIIEEADPAIYERDYRYDNNGYQNLLIITDIRKHFLHLSSVRINVFIHSMGNTCSVEIRISSGRSDKVAQGILDAVEQEIDG